MCFSELPPFRQPASAAHHAHQLHPAFLPDIFFVGHASMRSSSALLPQTSRSSQTCLELGKRFSCYLPCDSFIQSDSIQAWLQPRHQDLPCPICASADSFSRGSIAATSWPDSPCCTCSPSPEPPRGIFHTVCSSTCHNCLTLSSLPVFSKGADSPFPLLHFFPSQLESFSTCPSIAKFWMSCDSKHHCLPFCRHHMFLSLCT